VNWVTEYAKWKYNQHQDAWIAIDNKADRLLTYLGGGTPVLVCAVIFSAKEIGPLVSLAAIPTIILLIASILQALKVRNVGPFAAPPPIETARSCLEQQGEDSELAFTKDWGRATESLAKHSAEKRKVLARAFTCFTYAVTALLLPVIVAIAMAFCA